jgi:hypothetical protein
VKIYVKMAWNKKMTIMLSPGRDNPENSDWHELVPATAGTGSQYVRAPRSISVTFLKGVATVDNELGKYMIDKGLAHKRPQPEISGVHAYERPPLIIEVAGGRISHDELFH